MGTYNKGILGPFSGKVGTVVGAKWRGKDVMRSLPKKTDRPPSDLQLIQQGKFTFVSKFLNPISPVTSRYFGFDTGAQTRRNQAMSYHIKDAVNFVAPDYEILFNKVLISKGDMLGVQNPTASSPGIRQLQLTWDDNSGQGTASATDNLVVVLYAPDSDLYYLNLQAANREELSVVIDLPEYFQGVLVQGWITFVAANEKSYATSNYIGSLTIQ